MLIGAVMMSAAVLASCASTPDVPPAAPAEPGSPPAASPAAANGPPIAKVTEVKETTFGVAVSDPYRWMEELDTPELKDWVAKQNALTQAQLATMPMRACVMD